MTKTFSERRLFLVFIVLAIALVVDMTIGTIADIAKDFAISFWGLTLFVIIAAIYIFGQYYILGQVKAKIRERDIGRARLNLLEKIVTIVQYLLTAIMISIILQIIIGSQYYTSLLSIATAISYGLAICLMSFLAYQFFTWFKINRSLIVLLYGLAAGMIVVNAADSIVFFDVVLLYKNEWITPESEVIFETNFETSNPMYIVATLQAISLNAYFVLTWGGTVMLLYHNIKRIGHLRFWALVTPPILFFMSFYISFYETINPPNPTETPIIPMLLVVFSIIAATALFGIAFISVARSLNRSNYVRGYLSITGCGFILFFIAAAAGVLQAGYPPFGLAGVSYVGPASFLVLAGLYQSAIAVAQDVKLRQSLKKSADTLKLLDSIGKAEMQAEVEKKVMAAMKANAEQLKERSGIEPSLTEEELREIIEQAARERKQANTSQKNR